MVTDKPFIGYRSPRRAERNNDRVAASNAPLALLRGWAAGTAGLPGDLEGLVRMLPGIERKEPVLPTSEFYKEWLPLRGDSPTERAFTELGNLTGGAGATNVARALKTGASAGSRGALSAIRTAAENAAVPRTLHPQAGVIKMKGGNWLTGSVEDALKGLKRTSSGNVVRGVDQGLPIELSDLADFEAIAAAHPEHAAALNLSQKRSDAALNTWLDKKLARYVKNEMATPEDPVRALAERGVLHYEPRPTSGSVGRAMEHRAETGFPTGGYSENDLARNYEIMTDSSVRGESARSWLDNASEDVLSTMPWINKVPPETMVYEKNSPGLAHNLGFDHLVDELRNATNPQSGLPRELLWKYSDLDKVTVPQAVQRVSDINAWRAAQKAEADLLRANNAATVLHKEYPEGYRWVELKSRNPDEFEESIAHLPPKEWQASIEKFRSENESALKDALKYEGDTMGHCVGGYCDDVAAGKSRIYSLRDKKGQPHTTIEVAPVGRNPRHEEVIAEMKAQNPESMNLTGREWDIAYDEAWHSVLPKLPPRIVQIKGKQNRAPNPEYLPFVQDFVRSGKWSDVGDLGNTGLVEYTKKRQTIPRGLTGTIPKFDEAGIPEGFYTEDELVELMRGWQNKSGNTPGYARGGSINT